MNLDTIYEDSYFSEAVVPPNYILTFIGYSDGVIGGDIVKRYKDSDGNFGVLLGGSTGMSDEEAYSIIMRCVASAEESLRYINEANYTCSNYKDILNSILGVTESPESPEEPDDTATDQLLANLEQINNNVSAIQEYKMYVSNVSSDLDNIIGG